ARMKKDIVAGAQLPAFTLAIKPDTVSSYDAALEHRDLGALEDLVNRGASVHILDGLQRTYILKDIERSNNGAFNPEQRLLLEFKSLLATYCDLDNDVCRVYPRPAVLDGAPTGLAWWGSENVMNAFFAAVADFSREPERRVRATHALDELRSTVARAHAGEDP